MESTRLFEQLNQIWQKMPQRKLSTLVTVLLVLYAAHLSSSLVWRLFPQSSDHGDVVTTPVITGSQQKDASLDVTKLVSLNLFGQYQAVVNRPKPVVKTNNAPKTKLNLTLTGLVADSSSDTSATSIAIIENRSNQSSYGIGEKIDGTSATVHQIFIDRVILLVNGRYETLMLDGVEYSTTVPGTVVSDTNPTASASTSEPTVKLDQNSVTKPKAKRQVDKRADVQLSQELREQRKQLFDDPKKLLDYIRIRPFRQSGKLVGYRLTPGKDPKLFQQVGLKHNDLATNINGYDLTDMQQALSVMKELKTMTEANITVVRDDATIEIILAL